MSDAAFRLRIAPGWAPKSARGFGAICLSAPFLLMAAVILAACLLGLDTRISAGHLSWIALQAALAVLLCVILAIPCAALRPGWPWLAALFLTFSAGAAGWALLNLQEQRPPLAIEVAGWLLPFTVFWLAGAWPRRLASLAASASCAGASRSTVLFAIGLPLCWPAIASTCLILFPLACGAVAFLAG